MRKLPSPAIWLVAASVFAGPALAQSVMSPGAMPPPPSARDALPRSTSDPDRKDAAKPRRPAAGEATGERPRRPAAARAQAPREPAFSERIDRRPARLERPGAFQLEDDPRGGVAPVIQNGRPGVGMRF